VIFAYGRVTTPAAYNTAIAVPSALI